MKIYNGHPESLDGRTETETGTYALLDSLGISYITACHDPAFTMEECEAVEKDLGVGICKNLFLCNRQQTRFYLLMIPADKVFKTKYLSSQLGLSLIHI